jgi:transposase
MRGQPAFHGGAGRRSGDRVGVPHGNRRSRAFARSRDVGAYFGLTPKRHQSGTSIDWDGRISRQGDNEVRTVLYEAASGLLVRSKRWSALKAWGMLIQRRRGHKKVVVAVARKLAIILHAM